MSERERESSNLLVKTHGKLSSVTFVDLRGRGGGGAGKGGGLGQTSESLRKGDQRKIG